MNEVAPLLMEILQGTLNTIKNRADKARPQLHIERQTKTMYWSARADAGGVFIYLNGGEFIIKAYHFSYQPFLSNLNQFIHGKQRGRTCLEYRAADHADHCLMLCW